MIVVEYDYGNNAGVFAAMWFFATGEHLYRVEGSFTFNGVQS